MGVHRHVHKHVGRHVRNMCVGMCVGMWVPMYMGMCVDICADMCIDTCLDMCVDMGMIGNLRSGQCRRQSRIRPMPSAISDRANAVSNLGSGLRMRPAIPHGSTIARGKDSPAAIRTSYRRRRRRRRRMLRRAFVAQPAALADL